MVRSFSAIDRSDVVLMLIDAQQGVTEQDTKIAGYVDEQGKAAIIVVNKWDAVDKETGTMDAFVKQLRTDLKFMAYAPVLFISALTGPQAHHHRPAQRHAGRCPGRHVAPQRQRAQAEDLLWNPTGHQTAHLHTVCERQYLDALLLRALSGKSTAKGLWF